MWKEVIETKPSLPNPQFVVLWAEFLYLEKKKKKSWLVYFFDMFTANEIYNLNKVFY